MINGNDVVNFLQKGSGILYLTSMPEKSTQNNKPTPNNTLTPVVIHTDNTITFRVFAPKAKKVMLGGGDIPDILRKGLMTKNDNGVWEVTAGPVEPGAYRYNFSIDGVSVIDPRRPDVSESNMNLWSLVYVPGRSYMDIQNVPHGAVSEVNYFSTALNRYRRMHIYTPPGYEKNNKSYPVFYLLHGAFDSDNSWSTVGRAGFILDNLIAEKKAAPMIVVMPAGHTGPFPSTDPSTKNVDDFVEDFNQDIKPFVETNFRTLNRREDRAIAGLSMGGAQTLNIAIPHLDQYAYIGVFSSGIFGITGENYFVHFTGKAWEENNEKYLNNNKLKKGLKVFWFATGKDDYLLQTSIATVDMLRKHKFNIFFKETGGAHTWNNWRDYLHQFAQLLFK